MMTLRQKKPLRIAVGDAWHPQLLPFFGMALMALMMVTNVLNLKVIAVNGVSFMASSFTYVLSLILADVMTEVYGYRRVRRMLYCGVACLVFYAAATQIAVQLPPSPSYTNNDAFRALFSQNPRIIGASIIAYFVTELTGSFIMSRLKIRLNARHFYGRALTAVGIAKIVDAFVFFSLAFAFVLPLKDIVSAAAISWFLSISCELFILPVTKKIAWRVKSFEGVEHYDAAPRV